MSDIASSVMTLREAHDDSETVRIKATDGTEFVGRPYTESIWEPLARNSQYDIDPPLGSGEIHVLVDSAESESLPDEWGEETEYVTVTFNEGGRGGWEQARVTPPAAPGEEYIDEWEVESIEVVTDE